MTRASTPSKGRPGPKDAKTFASANAAVKSLESRHGPRAGQWVYTDSAGQPVQVVVRFNLSDGAKEFRPCHLGSDGWVIGALPAPRPLYRLPFLAAAELALVNEGEKAADAAFSLGFIATTSAGGAQAADKTDWSPLAGKTVVIIPDNDVPGRKYAEQVTAILAKLDPPAMVKVIELHGLPPKGDLYDWVALREGKPKGEVAEELARLIDDAPQFKPASNSRDNRDRDAGHEGWNQPHALPEMPPVPAFPIEVFPSKVADYWKACARSLAVPVDYVAVPGLTMLGAAVGRTRAVGIKNGYTESPSTWTVVIAPPGSVKSASLKFARAPLADAESDWMTKHAAALEVYEAEVDRHSERMKTWRKDGCLDEPPEKPRRPKLRQSTLDSTTTEAAAKVLGDNERGVVMVKDEMSGFVRSMNQYRGGGKGDDKQFWLSAWAGAQAKVNRAKDHDAGPLVIPHPFVAVTGMMTPSSLPELRGDRWRAEAEEDGFIDRYLFSFPDPVEATGETWDEVGDDLKKGYADVFIDLLSVEMVTEGERAKRRTRPYIVPLGDDARPVWEEFTKAIADRMNKLDKFDHFRGVLSKLKGYGARLAILLWSVQRACGDLGPEAPMDGQTLSRAAELIDYFEQHARRCLGVGWCDRKHRVAKRLLAWLSRHPDKTVFTRSEAFIQVKDRRDVTTGDHLDDPLRMLVDYGYARPADPSGYSRPGPKPEMFVVNPLWAKT